ncbi:DUF1573 domain-containing protein [Paracrocinitomix mangrovi]|uniref:DUF1573 domain-containing protein n=1 Tax=Paracrocinitomix mangrovi TaxID=2862509 RepID=UPI001C8DD057|nr:DUF1573 domain-containing protein [Paracrocinitomix mangrovi]UKN01790.1 DUF1573 domain-containing protein [Paracrocinitomix mangrovi]
MRKGFIYVFSALLLTACGGDSDSDNSGDNSSVVGNTNPNDAGSDGGNQSVFIPEDSKIEGMETTSIEYFESKHDFGSVFYPSDNKFTFKFKNTGEVPLVIDKAQASCGCTIPNKPEEPIPPGGIGEMDVIFRPKSGQVGQTVTKKITVTANTEPRETYLEITAKVLDAM